MKQMQKLCFRHTGTPSSALRNHGFELLSPIVSYCGFPIANPTADYGCFLKVVQETLMLSPIASQLPAEK